MTPTRVLHKDDRVHFRQFVDALSGGDVRLLNVSLLYKDQIYVGAMLALGRGVQINWLVIKDDWSIVGGTESFMAAINKYAKRHLRANQRLQFHCYGRWPLFCEDKL